nr:MAG TPA: hypothetical protein [Caudoviricetes sp.]
MQIKRVIFKLTFSSLSFKFLFFKSYLFKLTFIL